MDENKSNNYSYCKVAMRSVADKMSLQVKAWEYGITDFI